MGDLGVVSYLADAEGNVVIGPTTSIPTALLSKPPTPVKSKHPTSTTPAPPTPAPTAPLSPTSPIPTPEEKTKKKEKKKVTRRKDSVILKLPAGEMESVDATTSPVTPGQDSTPIVPPLPNTEAEASAEELPKVEE